MLVTFSTNLQVFPIFKYERNYLGTNLTCYICNFSNAVQIQTEVYLGLLPTQDQYVINF